MRSRLPRCLLVSSWSPHNGHIKLSCWAKPPEVQILAALRAASICVRQKRWPHRRSTALTESIGSCEKGHVWFTGRVGLSRPAAVLATPPAGGPRAECITRLCKQSLPLRSATSAGAATSAEVSLPPVAWARLSETRGKLDSTLMDLAGVPWDATEVRPGASDAATRGGVVQGRAGSHGFSALGCVVHGFDLFCAEPLKPRELRHEVARALWP